MLGSITPLGERGRRSRWGITVAWFLLGAALGGMLAGGVLGSVGAALGRAVGLGHGARLIALATVVALGAALDLRLFGVRLPSVHRQVSEDWLGAYRSWVYGLGFGVQLGLGVVTIVTTSAVYAALAAALLTGSGWAGLAVGGAFGLSRGSTVLAAGWIRTPQDLTAADAAIHRWEAPARQAALAAQGLVVMAAVALIRIGR
jgi:sulfite exporter TauE/SafE